VSDGDFLSRWSRRKIDARAGREPPEAPPAAAPIPVAASAPGPPPTPPEPLPPVESLTFDSDITPFLEPHVDEALRRRALKVILQDPRFNVMDGLDVYIDDYSVADPMPPEWLDKLAQAARLGDYREPPPEPAEGPQRQPAAEEAKAESDQGDGLSEPEPVAAPIPTPPVRES
jgi:hypothetical protein